MKLLVLLKLLLCCSICFAQNWSPFKRSDSIIHYEANESVYGRYAIQSIILDSVLQDSNNNKKVLLRKGYSINHLYDKRILKTSNRGIPVKGFMLGDTIDIGVDTTICTSIDPRGFKYKFPHSISVDSSWEFGISSNMKINATVDTISYDTLSNGILDSVAYLFLEVLDTNGAIASFHHFNSRVSISKNHGIINSLDLTNLDTLYTYTKHFDLSDSITNNQNNELTVGDEYHTFSYYYGSFLNPPPFHGIATDLYTVLSDTNINDKRYISLKRERQGRVPSSTRSTKPITIDTIKYSFKKDSIYCYNHSGIASQSYLQQILWVTQDREFNRLIKIDTQEPSRFGIWRGLAVDSIHLYPPAGSFYNTRIIGIASEFLDYQATTSNPHQSQEYLVYIKKGAQTWGHNARLVTSLEEATAVERFEIFPNPTNNILNIRLSQELQIKEIGLFDLLGKEQEVRIKQNQVVLSNLPGGIYFFRLQLTNGETLIKKLIKN